jgi:tagaturonate reductase
MPLPETILQFGAGRFLRAFADMFVHQANQEGQEVGRIVVVQSTGVDRAALLNRQGGQYHVLIRGLARGSVVDRMESVASISRALVANSQWHEVLALARSPHLRVVLSNTTEVGYALDPTDKVDSIPPLSFPAKLLMVLKERCEANLPGLAIVPCELREHNADCLQKLLLEQAAAWSLPQSFSQWLKKACSWHNTLVDRIVAGPPHDHPMSGSDSLLTVCEPYALWAIKFPDGQKPFAHHPNICWTQDVQPFFLRKVRLLNGAHTALVIKAGLDRFKTVKEAMSDAALSTWLERLLFDEIVPTIDERVEGAAHFARDVLERFRNPFLDHKLKDIAAYHEDKVKVRLVPTFEEYQAKFGKAPPLLAEVLKAPVSPQSP